MNLIKNKIFLISIIAFLFLIGCESIVESVDKKFKDEEYKVLETDKFAATALADTIFESIKTAMVIETMQFDTTGNTIDTTYKYELTHADTTELIDSDEPDAILDVLSQDDILISETETTYRVRTGSEMDETYFCLDNAGTRKVVIYLDDYVGFELYDSDGTIVEPYSTSFPMETVAEFRDLIKTRVIYELTDQNYLIKFITSDKTLGNTFNLVFLEE